MNIKNKVSFSKRLLCTCILLGGCISTQASVIDRAVMFLDVACQTLVNNLTEVINNPEEALQRGGERILNSTTRAINNLADRVEPLRPSRYERFLQLVGQAFERLALRWGD